MSEINENNEIQKEESANISSEETQQTPLINEAIPEMSGAEVISGVELKSKSPISIIVAIAAAFLILVMGGFSAYAFNPWVKNNVKMALSSDENYFEWVFNENIEKSAEEIADIYDKITDVQSNDGTVLLKSDLESDTITEAMENESGVSLADFGITIPESISISAQSGESEDDVLAEGLQLNLNDETVLTANMFFKDGKIYYQIPELSSSYIEADISSLSLYESYDFDSEDIELDGDALTEILTNGDLQDLLSDDELEDFIVKYMAIFAKNVQSVEKEKNAEVEVNGVKAEYTLLTAKIDEGTAYSFAKEALTEAKDDETIIKLVNKLGLFTEDEYKSEIENLLDELGSYEVKGGETICNMKFYVDSKGVIRGIDAQFTESSGMEDLTLKAMTAVDGDKTVLDMAIAENEEGLTIVGEETNKKDVYNADYQISVSDTVIGLKCNDVEVVSDDNDYCKGEIVFDLSSFDLGEIAVNLESDGKSQDINTDITVDGTKYASVSMNISNEKAESLPVFDSSQKVYNTDNADEYLSEVDIESVTSKIKDITGIDLYSLFSTYPMVDDTLDTEYIDDYSDIEVDDDDYFFNEDEEDYPEPVSYDFSKLEIKLDGQKIVLPGKIEDIFSKVKFEHDTIDGNTFEYISNDDYTVAVCLENQTDKAAKMEDCIVSSISVSEGAPVSISVDGITIGSDIKDVVKKYGCELTDSDYGYVTIEDSTDDYDNLTFFYYDDKVYEIDIDLY